MNTEENSMLPKQISLTSDVGFKRAFAVDGSQEMVTEFVKTFGGEDVSDITGLEFLPNEQFDEINVNQKVIFDLFSKDKDGNYHIVEMQKVRRRFPMKRGLSYACRAISSNTRIEDNNYIIPKVTVFCIMEEADKKAVKRGKWLWTAKMRDEDGEIISQDITFVFLELSIFASLNIEPKTEQELWMHMMCNMSELDEIPEAAIGNSALERLFERCKFKNMTDMEKKEYLESIYEYPDVCVALSERFDEGMEEGFLKGVAEGEARGEERGEERGRAEGKAEERLAMAKSLLLQGVNIGIITKATGLTEEEIKAQI